MSSDTSIFHLLKYKSPKYEYSIHCDPAMGTEKKFYLMTKISSCVKCLPSSREDLQLDHSWETWLDHMRAGEKKYLCVGGLFRPDGISLELIRLRGDQVVPFLPFASSSASTPSSGQRHQRLLTRPSEATTAREAREATGRPSRQQQHRRLPMPKQAGHGHA
jgi:hypothetical protein